MNDKQVIYFDPDRARKYPYFALVDELLQGIETIMFPDGTEQIAWQSQYPDVVFSPRLPMPELELFLKNNIQRYKDYSKQYQSEILDGDDLPPIEIFWNESI